MKLTEEQKQVIKSLAEKNNLKVNAYAGTGKTTTMVALGQVFKSEKLVVAFNRSVAEELRRKMPPDAEVKTIHALAFRLTNMEKGKIAEREEFMDELIELFDDKEIRIVKFYADLFAAWCNSEFTEITPNVINKILSRVSDLKKTAKILARANNIPFPRLIEDLTDSIDYIRFAVERGSLPITHDYYLKLFQLRLDDYSKYLSSYGLLIVDEAQDINGVQEYFIKHVPIERKVIVGDKHQQIYSWRLAINSMVRLDWPVENLTTSFRFQNDSIVQLVNEFLKNWTKDAQEIKAYRTNKTNGLKAHIFRTNSRLVQELIEIDEPIRPTRSIDDIFRSVEKAERLYKFFRTGDREWLKGLPFYVAKHAELLMESGCRSVRSFANGFMSINEPEYAFGIFLASNLSDLQALKDKAKKLERRDAKLVLSTAHSAKGLEFDEVSLGEDFPDLISFIVNEFEEDEIKTPEDAKSIVEGILNYDDKYASIRDEINLQYVAITRAMHDLDGGGYAVMRRNITRGLTAEDLYDEMIRKKKALASLQSANDLWNFDLLDDDMPF